MDYAEGEVIFGAGTDIQYAILDAGSRTRPTTGMKLLKGVTTSEIKGSQTVREAPGDYDTEENGWDDGKTTRTGWGFTMTANVKKNSDQAAALEEIWDAWAAKKEIWIERLRPEDTKWRGGVAGIVDPTEPVPFDGAITFSCGFTGRGALVKTAVTVTP